MAILVSVGLFTLLLWQVQCSVLKPQIPSVASFRPSNRSFELSMSPSVRIVVDTKYAHYGNPTLFDYATTFREDLQDTLSSVTLPPIELSSVVPDSIFGIPTIYLTLDPSLQYTLYNGRSTDEGYDFQVSQYVLSYWGGV